jgi:arylsulfatase A-like enzyme
MKNRYDNALSYIDDQIGRMVSYLKDHKLYDQSLIIIVGDHGEAFYEKDVACHATDLDAESAHTFIMLKTPYGALKGVRDDFVQNIDIPPTICHFLNINPHPAFQGGDFLGNILFDQRPIFISLDTPMANQDGIILNGWKFIEDYKKGRESLFHLKNDMMERRDLILEFPGVAASLKSQLMVWRSTQLDYYQDQDKQKEFYPSKFILGKNNQG